MIASGNKIGIRNIEYSDISNLVRWWNDGRLMASVGFKNGLGITKEELIKKFTPEIEDTSLRTRRTYIVVDLKTNKAIGEVTYGALNNDTKTCRLGMKICELEYQGKGYGKDTIITFIDYLFTILNLNKLEIDTFADNIRALSLYKKVGFKETKYENKFWTDPEGISHDVVFLELNKD